MRRTRGRKRLSRMDAALDAMKQLGFTEEKIKKCVKQLLRVYGGEDAWPFIEDGAYDQLMEALLRDAEEDQKNAIEDGQNVEDRGIEDDTDLETSNAVSDKDKGKALEDSAPGNPAESTLALTVAERAVSDHVSSSSLILASHPDQANPQSAHEKGGGGVSKEGVQNHPSGDLEAQTGTVTGNKIITKPSKNSAPPASPPAKVTSPLPSNSAPMRRRSRPCYGWIDSDDEEPPDLISFEPAPGALSAMAANPPKRLSFSITPSAKAANPPKSVGFSIAPSANPANTPKRVSFSITPVSEGRQRRRPSRWDVRPGE